MKHLTETLAFTILVLMAFNMIILHAVIRMRNDVLRQGDINSSIINNLIEKDYKCK